MARLLGIGRATIYGHPNQSTLLHPIRLAAISTAVGRPVSVRLVSLDDPRQPPPRISTRQDLALCRWHAWFCDLCGEPTVTRQAVDAAVSTAWEQGQAKPAIAMTLDTTVAVIHQRLRRLGLRRPTSAPLRPPIDVQVRLADLRARRTRGETLDDIGRVWGISGERVRQLLAQDEHRRGARSLDVDHA